MPEWFSGRNTGSMMGVQVDMNGRALPSAQTAAIASPLKQKEASKFGTKVDSILEFRLPKTQWSIREISGVLAYLGLNGLCLAFNSSGVILANQLGFLAGANALLVVVPSTRNSLLVWLFGLPFDRVVVFHRFLGRLLGLLSLAHFVAYAMKWSNESKSIGTLAFQGEDPNGVKGVRNSAGTVALIMVLAINLLSIGWLRRKHFNIFYYSHFLFIGFYVALYYHHPEMYYYCLGVIILYAIDRTIRMAWSLIPYSTTYIRAKGDDIVQIQFPKNAMANMLGLYRIGQYVFG